MQGDTVDKFTYINSNMLRLNATYLFLFCSISHFQTNKSSAHAVVTQMQMY